MLTPKEHGRKGTNGVFPATIEHSALIESAYTIPGEVATDCTLALCFRPTAATVATMIDLSAHHHLVIQKQGTTVKLWKNGKALPNYTGTVGTTYGAFLQNVLIALSGSYHGYYSDLYVVEQSLEPSVFGEFTDLVTDLWVVKDAVIPTFQEPVLVPQNEGTVIGNMTYYGTAQAFDGVKIATGANSAWHETSAGLYGYLGKDWGAGNEKTLGGFKAWGTSDFGYDYSDGTAIVITLQGSTDNVSWVDLSALPAFSDTNTTNPKELLSGVNMDNAYRYSRISMGPCNGHGMAELEFYTVAEGIYGLGGGRYKFDNAANLGEDSSGNGNDATVTGMQTVDTMMDTFATLDPFTAQDSPAALSSGNLRMTGVASGTSVGYSTQSLPIDGKFAFQGVLATQVGINQFIGIFGLDEETTGGAGTFKRMYRNDGYYYNGTAYVPYGASYTTSNVLRVEVDRTADTLEFFKDNVSQGVISSVGMDVDVRFAPMVATYGGASVWDCAFGSTGWVDTPTAGFKALSSANRPDPTTMKSSTVVDLVKRVGTGAAAAVTGLDFAPDWVNQKVLDAVNYWCLSDTVRGANNQLYTNAADPAGTDVGQLTAFNADGYDLGAYAMVNGLNLNYIDLAMKAGAGHGFEMVRSGTGVFPITTGKKPCFILHKSLARGQWYVWHKALGNDTYITLTTAAADISIGWCVPTATEVTIPGATTVDSVCYIFTDSDIFEAFSCIGNLSADGPLINLDGTPLSVPFVTNSSIVSVWINQDAERDPINPVSSMLKPHAPDAAVDLGTSPYMQFLANGVKMVSSSTTLNGSNNLIIDLAIKKRTSKHLQGF